MAYLSQNYRRESDRVAMARYNAKRKQQLFAIRGVLRAAAQQGVLVSTEALAKRIVEVL